MKTSSFKKSALLAIVGLWTSQVCWAQGLYYVDPARGNDATGTGGFTAPYQTLAKAKEQVAAWLAVNTQQADIYVYLRGGTYSLASAVAFTPADSGENGHDVIYQNYGTEVPVISGGQQVTGWAPVAGSNQWVATVTDPADFRNLWVNGVRCKRASSATTLTGSAYYDDPAVSGTTKDGIVVAASAVGAYANADDVELVWKIEWKHLRAPVRSISSPNATTRIINMQQPYFSWATDGGGGAGQAFLPGIDDAFSIENAYELLDAAGEFYYNKATEKLFYIPRPGETMSTATVVVPKTKQLLKLAGTGQSAKVHNIRFSGLAFQYTQLNRANTYGAAPKQGDQWFTSDGGYLLEAGISLNWTNAIRIEQCSFKNMGTSGLQMEQGCDATTITRNHFYDISGSAISIGTWRQQSLGTSQELCNGNIISQNLIQKAAAEYFSSCGILMFYGYDNTFTHNEIDDVPYTGISVGWGWNDNPMPYRNYNNNITFNKITNYMTQLRDGAGIYVLGGQGPSRLANNYVAPGSVGPVYGYAGFYFDNGSANWTVNSNVAEVKEGTTKGWINLAFRGDTENITATGNYTRSLKIGNENVYEDPLVVDGKLNNEVKRIVIDGTTHTPTGAWPAAAQAIINAAGVEPPLPLSTSAGAVGAEVSLSGYPNPLHGPGTLELVSAAAGNTTVYLFDTQGRLVRRIGVRLQVGTTRWPLPAGLAPGTYQLHCQIGGKPRHFALQVE